MNLGWLMQECVLPLMLLPTRSQAMKHARRIRQCQRMPLEKLRGLQLNRLRELVELAAAESPFYSDLFRANGFDAEMLGSLDDLQRVPVTTKDDVEANFPDGMVIASRRSDDWQYVGTRGTTRRVMVVHDFQRRDFQRAAIMVALTEDSPYRYGAGQFSIPPDACSVHCGLEGNRADSVSGHLWAIASGRIKRDRAAISDLRGLVMEKWIQPTTIWPPLSLDEGDLPLAECVAALRQAKPTQLTALPEYLKALADYLDRSGEDPPHIPVVRPMGANLPASWKPAIADAFRGSVREHYGSREMGPMAFDCGQANGLHVMMDQHLIEVVRDGATVGEGELGRVLVTDLNNFAMPLIRYDIGDLARITYAPCACGRTSPRLLLEGRVQDAFVLSGGRVLTAEDVSNHFAELPEIRDFELTEMRGNKWALRVVPQPLAKLDLQQIGDRFVTWSGESRRINVRSSTAIRPESSGKYRHCKSLSFGKLLAEQEPIPVAADRAV
ncbi:phenylacetate--CoA ligase family protein [Roseiconus nitratireducens]|uniref:Phenylacetate--CoA ligase family protein n=1 Tax=Roseiconus nitratireducens TaxID=2605748 RepID=A0A5M6DFE0_9BACT|nr:phenylacetate--CoA ligase family protein [Roseiconus nitratireducens]KAA5546267.1 phenylacetate--CoA ligase family protein [Roseiconus nitratireducens]